MQGFRKDQDFEITDAAEADFDFGNAGAVDVYSQVQDPIRQLLLGEPGARPQPRLADTRADDVLSCTLNSLRCGFHSRRPVCTLAGRCCSQAETAFGKMSGLSGLCRVYVGFRDGGGFGRDAIASVAFTTADDYGESSDGYLTIPPSGDAR